MPDMAPGTSNMLRARRKDINVKPNRRLDRKSSRGMLFENEELRLRTININAEVEKGQSDIKKLRKENEHLRREIWGLRDEYDRLESLLKKRSCHESENEDEEYDQEEDEEYDQEEDVDEEGTDDVDDDKEGGRGEDLDNAENQQKATTTATTTGLRADFDGLSVVDEEGEGGSMDADPREGAEAPPYCGTITLPDGRQGVFFSDAMVAPRRKVNGAGPSPEEYRAFLAERNNTTYPCYDELAPDCYAARAGPDIFVTGGCYPDGLFPQLPAVDPPVPSITPPEATHGTSNCHDREVDKMGDSWAERGGGGGSGAAVARGTPWRRLGDASAAALTATTTYSPEYFPLRGGRRLRVLRRRRLSVVASRRRGSQRVTTQTTTTTTASVQRGREGRRGDRPHTLVLRADWPDLTAREVIDALESQLGDCSGVLGVVRAQPGQCYICVPRSEDAAQLLGAGLELRGRRLHLGDASRESVLLSLSGVPLHVEDSAVALLANNFGAVLGDVERRTYKGVDTGERLLRIRPHASSDVLPQAVVLAGSKVELKVIQPHHFDALDHADIAALCDQQAGCSSSDNSLAADSRFRSQLNVRLRLPGASPESSPPPPPFFQTLPACRRTPWSALDSPQPSAPSNPFAADYQATLPCSARRRTPDIAVGNPFTFPQAATGCFERPQDPRVVDGVAEAQARPPADKKTSVGVQHSAPTTPTGTPVGRRDRLPREAGQGAADGEGPSVASTPSARKKSSTGRKASVAAGEPADASRCSSSSGQDSPTKSERRRRVSIHFNKRSMCGARKDSSAMSNGTGHQRSVSLDHARARLEAGDGTTTSERERTNSISSKSSSAVGGARRNHTAKDADMADHKVPWCGCWGNGCI